LSSEKPLSYVFKGSFILVSFVAAQLAGTVVLQYLIGNEITSQMSGVFIVCIFLFLPGGVYLGKAVSTQLITTPYFELDESNKEEIIATTEKVLKDLVESLEDQSLVITKASNILENFSSKIRIYSLVYLVGIFTGIALVYLLFNFSAIVSSIF
jgi:hypothetical protein